MKPLRLNYPLAAVLVLAVACSKTTDPSPSSAASTATIKSDAEAKAAYNFIKSVYDAKIKPTLPVNKSATISTQLTGGTGKATVSGNVSYTNSSSSLSSFTSTIIDVTSAFSAYTDGGFVVNGSVRYFDSHDFRSSCTSGGSCAYSSHTSLSNSATGLTVEFEYNGKKIKDVISIDASAPILSWTIKVTTSSGVTYTW